MLGKLVNRFKRQTLQDGGDSPPSQSSPPLSGGRCNGPMRRSARLNEKAGRTTVEAGGYSSHSPPNSRSRKIQQSLTSDMCKKDACDRRTRSSAQLNPTMTQVLGDSGTESDDDELEMLESMSNASMQSFPRGNGIMADEVDEDGDGFTGSPPTLTSSPPLISEIDTSSWDSCGCESGIILRDSAERDDASRNIDLLEAAFGGGEMVIKPKGMAREGEVETAGTTPLQSKDAFSTHFRSMPIDFSALRNSELLSGGEDAPTPIGSQRESGRGAILMDVHLAQNEKSRQSQKSEEIEQPESHQGAFRRVLRQTRRNSNSVTGAAGASAIAARTVSPQLSVGLGEKRRWGDNAVVEQQQQQQLAQITLPIATRTRGSLMGALMSSAGDANVTTALGSSEFPRPVLTAARRTRVRVLYSSQQHQQSLSLAGSQQQNARRGQMQSALGQSPPTMLLVANKRGRHSSKSSNSPHRPSLNFDKMRKRMLNGGAGGNGPSSGGDGVTTARGE